ncbi:hypothetical protein FISHEDRAFT_62569 [Fistulina hepatica ATCC 64428]|nr:hypothetical protein FISHEDRAFT_62569 [Fistulina hepatica ATCC 64428]
MSELGKMNTWIRGRQVILVERTRVIAPLGTTTGSGVAAPPVPSRVTMSSTKLSELSEFQQVYCCLNFISWLKKSKASHSSPSSIEIRAAYGLRESDHGDNVVLGVELAFGDIGKFDEKISGEDMSPDPPGGAERDARIAPPAGIIEVDALLWSWRCSRMWRTAGSCATMERKKRRRRSDSHG